MLAALLALAAPAAACPTDEDTARGIEITYADGSRSVITRNAAGEVREAEYFDGDTPYIYISANGLIETGYRDPDSGASDKFSYTFDTDDLLPLQPWFGRAGEQIVTDADGVEVDRVGYSFQTRAEITAIIGDCSYRAIPLETYYRTPGDPSMVEFLYLLDLGIPVNVGYAYLAGGFGAAEPNAPVAIAAVPEE